MKQITQLFLLTLCITMAFTACSKDEEDSVNPSEQNEQGSQTEVIQDTSGGQNTDVGKDNTTDKAVTGGVTNITTSCPDANHPHMIDLGIGTLWSCCNVGASAPEQYGNYYAWGETQPKSVYNWDTYQYGSSLDDVVNIGSDISGTQYDAARANWGAPWRMPTLAECEALLNKCTSEWTVVNFVYGRKFKGPNGGTIFLPAAGWRIYSSLDESRSRGYYWSSALSESYPSSACSLDFGSGGAYRGLGGRDGGFCVRPVR